MQGYKTRDEIAELLNVTKNTIARYDEILQQLEIKPIQGNNNAYYYSPQFVAYFEDMHRYLSELRNRGKNPSLESYLEVVEERMAQEMRTISVEYSPLEPQESLDIKYSLISKEKLSSCLSQELQIERDRKVTEWYQGNDEYLAFQIFLTASNYYGFSTREIQDLIEIDPHKRESFYWNCFYFEKRTTDCPRWYPSLINLELGQQTKPITQNNPKVVKGEVCA